jgi:hypothetical protein
MKDGTCVLCADGNFYCDGYLYHSCPPNVFDDSCAEIFDGGIGDCLDCSNGIGTLFRCCGEKLITPFSRCIQ